MADDSKDIDCLKVNLIKAMKEEDLETLEKVVGTCNNDFSVGSFLHAVVDKGSSTILKLLLQYGADVNAVHAEKEGYTLLHHAADKDQFDAARILIKYKANVNTTDGNGKFPITYAIENVNFEMTKLLVSSGAKIKYPWEIVDGTPDENFWRIIKFLVDNDSGIDIDGRDKYGRTALNNIMCDRDDHPYMADMYTEYEDIRNLRRDLAKTLLRRGADVDGQMPCGWSLLHCVIYNNDNKFLKILLKYKANVNVATTDDMCTPLHLATGSGNYSATRMLIDAGARVNAKDVHGESVLTSACDAQNKEIVETLLKFGAKVDDTDKQNLTSMYTAATNDFEIVETLLGACADVEYRDTSGITALHMAVFFKCQKNVEELLEYGADINRTCKPEELEEFARRLNDENEDNVVEREALILLNICNNELRSDQNGSFANIVDVIRRHITKLKSLNMYVDKRYHESSLFVDESEEYRIICEREVELMKREKIRRSNVSYYDILKKSTDQLASLTRNKRITDILESLSRTKRFPVFRKMLHYHLKKGQHRGNLLRSSLKTFNVLSRFALPESVSFDLLMHLSNLDLVNLIEADPNNDRR
uniref:Ankyrin repeat domain protein n=1 Tax=Glypta fumiferanae TaxID=389681 RepID=A0A0F6Y976_9HYME|nr:ankyrin repeat domain protein [Glypta fumiferanae]